MFPHRSNRLVLGQQEMDAAGVDNRECHLCKGLGHCPNHTRTTAEIRNKTLDHAAEGQVYPPPIIPYSYKSLRVTFFYLCKQLRAPVPFFQKI